MVGDSMVFFSQFNQKTVYPFPLGANKKALVERLVDALKDRQSRCLMLEVRASNTGAQLLYEILGFVQVGIRKNYYRNPKEDALILRKEWEI